MGTLTGDPVTDDDLIVRQFILANKQHLETQSKLKRVIDAAQVLGMRRRDLKKQFEKRNIPALYNKYLRRKY